MSDEQKTDVEEAAEELAEAGLEDVGAGLDEFEAADDVGMASRVALAVGASDVSCTDM